MSDYTIHPVPVEHFGWIIQRTGCIVTSDFRAIAALDSKGIIRGMVAYCNFTENSAQMHAAIDTPAAVRALVYENDCPIFRRPFLVANLGLLIAVVRGSNEAALRVDKHLGFKETYRIKDGLRPGEDWVILEMRREDCRWLKTNPKALRTPMPREERAVL